MNSIDLHSSVPPDNEHRLIINAILFANLAQMIIFFYSVFEQCIADVFCRQHVVDSDGYFYVLDRLKDMIVTGGENVYSGEVEAVIYKHPAVHEVAVFGIPDPQWGEVVMACVVLKPRMALSANDLTSHCRQFLANYKIPRRVEFSDAELPKSGACKILKRILREHFWTHEERAVG
jgi:acyl-CoA synthetase (AMP-forming)/AMP-acid ligase II